MVIHVFGILCFIFFYFLLFFFYLINLLFHFFTLFLIQIQFTSFIIIMNVCSKMKDTAKSWEKDVPVSNNYLYLLIFHTHACTLLFLSLK